MDITMAKGHRLGINEMSIALHGGGNGTSVIRQLLLHSIVQKRVAVCLAHGSGEALWQVDGAAVGAAAAPARARRMFPLELVTQCNLDDADHARYRAAPPTQGSS